MIRPGHAEEYYQAIVHVVWNILFSLSLAHSCSNNSKMVL